MVDSGRAFLSTIVTSLQLVPNWLVAVILLAIAIFAALAAHAAIIFAMRHTLGNRHPKIRALLTNSKGPARLGLIVLAMSLAIQISPVNQDVANVVSGLLNIAFIALLGWTAVTVTDIASQIYLLRFKLDVGDNLLARKHVTQVKLLKRAADVLIIVLTTGAALMTFPQVRQYGVSLFASAGVAGLAVGLAARPLLSNLIAGIQIAVAQPIRIDDVVIVENEYGTIEEITTSYVVIKLWDWRRMVVPLSYFIEKPFQNWTRETSSLIGSVFLYTDYTVPLEPLRARLNEIVRESEYWDGQVVGLQVTDAKERVVELRALVSAQSAPIAWNLRCEVREKLLVFLQENYPHALPHGRHHVSLDPQHIVAPGAAKAGDDDRAGLSAGHTGRRDTGATDGKKMEPEQEPV